MHIELVSASATQPNTGAAAAALTGDSLTIKNARPGSKVSVIASWLTLQVAGFLQIAFPSGHDTTRGYRAGGAVGVNTGIIPFGTDIDVTPQELLSLQIAGSNTAGDVENASMLIHYENMPGIDARLINFSELRRRTDKMTTIEASIASSAGPGYSGSESLDTDSNLMLANRDYALIGMSSRTAVHSIWMQGPDTGNVRIGCPGVLRQELTTGFFAMLSRATGKDTIPVINSGNRNATTIGVATDENAGTFVVTLYLALLK